jgi:thiosulfate reductase/polysulfide reductase chain A
MSRENRSKWKLDRRTFLSTVGALGAAMSVESGPTKLLQESKAAAPAASTTVKLIPTWCHGCAAAATSCAVLCHVEDGKLVRIEGNPDAGNNWGLGSTSLCVKAHSAMQYEYSPDRLTYPMKRVGDKGAGKFQRITWEEALVTIAAKLKEVKEKYGPETFCLLVPEFYPVRDTLGRRFLNVYGSPNYCESALCHGPRYLAATWTVGFCSEAPDDWTASKLIVNWGSNCENSGVNRGQPIAILDALEKGTRMIDIRPMLDPMASKAAQWLPIRPGTDCALALSVLNVIIGEKLYDVGFVSEWCSGFDRLAEHVKQFPPQWAAPITGIPADQIAELARTMATTKPMCIKTGNGVGDQQNDGSSAMMAITLIEAITGNLDVPGGNYAGASLPNLIPTRNLMTETLAEKAPRDMVDRLLAPAYPRWLQKRPDLVSPVMFHTPQSASYKVLKSLLTGKPYTPRVLGVQQTSVLSQLRNPVQNAEALKKVDFMFVMDLYWSPAVNYADIVLPATSLYEQSHNFGIKNRRDGTWIGIRNKVVEPLGDTRTDWQFWFDLAVKMGYGSDFWNGDMDECLKYQLEPSGIQLEDLRASPRGILAKRTDPIPAPKYRRYAQLFKRLPNGKVQCYNELIGGKPDCDETGNLPFLPSYKGPPEGITQTPELAKEYPLIFSDVHAYRLSQHSSYHNLPYLRELQPKPWVKINPETARKYGIKNGDWMKIESRHGWVKMAAEYFEGIAPDVLMARRGWWQACEELGLPGYSVFNGGAEPNVLYNGNEKLFDTGACQMAKQTLVRISKA